MDKFSDSNESQMNKEKLLALKDEYHRLTYEMRKKELTRSSQHFKHQQQIRTQWAKIAELKKQKSELILQLRLLESDSFTNKGNKFLDNFNKSLQDLLKLEEKVKKETQELKKCKNEIIEYDKKIRHKQKEIVRVNRSKDRILKYHNNISFLEYRLNSSLNKYSQLMIANSSLRDDISSLLLTQISFRKKISNIKHLLSLGKKSLSEVIHSATVSYQTGESVKYKLNIIKERTQVDQKKLEEKIKELQLLVDQDKQLKDFLDFKTKDRYGSRESEEQERKNEKLLEQRLHNYQEILLQIQTVSGCKDVNRICKTYIQEEENNLKLFEKVNDLNLEIEKLYKEVRAQRDELEIITRQYKEQKRKDLALKNDIEDSTDALQREAQHIEDKADEKADELEYVKTVLQRIYAFLDDITTQKVTLDTELIITDDNILAYIESLECRVTDLIHYHRFLKNQQMHFVEDYDDEE
ncbi:cytadherence high molecular weight protein 2-like [Uloborus diversus]|uniref:cytadherence high molecular weight protein 2-like n=1 Tax=Uloborus diversus TaxID=327109 RepID=UPI002409D9F3|nr:cytadherence high molecular weight protein 2-like [Uloborus diversus]